MSDTARRALNLLQVWEHDGYDTAGEAQEALLEWADDRSPTGLRALLAENERLREALPSDQFLCDVRAVVAYHWSGVPERRPDESVWARLDAVLFDDEGQERKAPDWSADPLAAVPEERE